MPEDGIQVKILTADSNSTIFGVIVEELANGNYHTVVLGKRDLTKAQEFLVGSINAKLMREALVNVLSVKVPHHRAETAAT